MSVRPDFQVKKVIRRPAMIPQVKGCFMMVVKLSMKLLSPQFIENREFASSQFANFFRRQESRSSALLSRVKLSTND